MQSRSVDRKQVADQIVLLKQGRKIAEGPISQILRPDLIEETYGIPVRFVADPETQTPLVIAEADKST